MRLSLDTREHSFDIVEAADETGSKIKPASAELPAATRFVEHGQARAQGFVDDDLEGALLPAHELLEPGRHVTLKRQGGAHIMMLIL